VEGEEVYYRSMGPQTGPPAKHENHALGSEFS
jgi:hypothetical protein